MPFFGDRCLFTFFPEEKRERSDLVSFFGLYCALLHLTELVHATARYFRRKNIQLRYKKTHLHTLVCC